jgi:peptidoglycan/xylan/chitin deacetylase (PgdA/CDA1 family)
MLSASQLTGILLPHKTLCLTFDDGPGETTGPGRGPKTVKLAQHLHDEGIAATFFMTGRHIAQYPHLINQVLHLGHTIGNHTYNHPDFLKPETFANGETIISEVGKTQRLISEYYAAENIYFRAPYGSWSEVAANTINNMAGNINFMGPIGWDINANDWQFWFNEQSAEDCAAAYMKAIEETGKGIIVMHDSTTDNDIMRINNLTFETVQLLVPRLKAMGYTFVPLQSVPGIN